MNYGKGFERFIFELYKDLGYDVKLDQRLKRTVGNDTAHGQIDVVYKRFFMTHYIECKYRSNDDVNFDEYSKFETTLKTFHIPTYFAEMITNKGFDEKVRLRAKETKIKLIGNKELNDLNKIRNSPIKLPLMLLNAFDTFEKKGLDETIKYLVLRTRPIADQIEHYSRLYP